MKEGFQSIEIEPINGFLDFIGPAKDPQSETNQLLKGEVRLELTKTIKVRSMSVKFKGLTTTCHPRIPDKTLISAQILPKLKTSLFTKTTSLPPGKHILPWELEIPNIYPRSLSIKRGSVSYKIELTISLGIKNTITEEYPILIRRHLLPCKLMAPLVNTKTYSNTISTKFHYDIEAPRIVCVEQGYVPLSIKYLSIGNHKIVKNIRTQIIQVETYRNRNVSKAETDMSVNAKNNKNLVMGSSFGESHFKHTEIPYSKYGKRILPVIEHHLEPEFTTTDKPLLVSHQLNPYLIPDIDSPLASIYHQLEVTFHFGHAHDAIKAKIPIVVSSISSCPPSIPVSDFKPCYHIESQPHHDPSFIEIKNESSDNSKMVADSYYQSLVDVTNNLFGNTRPALRKVTSEQTISTIDTQSTPRRNSITAPVKRKPLAPLDVQLANKMNITPPQPNINDIEAELNELYKDDTPQPPSNRYGAIGLAPPPRGGRIKEARPELTTHLLDSDLSFEEYDDGDSLYSDTSSRAAPSLTSSSSGIVSLQSRPASPVYAAAPGLPATTALRPTDATPISLIEESYTTVPETPRTVASSAVFSPRTTYSMMREFYARPESTEVSLEENPITSHYIHAELPPIPQQQDKRAHRRTMIYYQEEESDEEEKSTLPPQLPRLSLGHSFASFLE